MEGDGGVAANEQNASLTLEEEHQEHHQEQKDLSSKILLSCAISGLPLREPIAACRLGYLYSKETVVQNLGEKTRPSQFGHIRSPADLIEVKFSPNPEFKSDIEPTEQWKSPYVCPVALVEYDDQHKFKLITTCGHVLSEKALLELPSTTCPQCQHQFTSNNVIVLNGTDDEVAELRKRIEDSVQEPEVETSSEMSLPPHLCGRVFPGTVQSSFDFGFFVSIEIDGKQYKGVILDSPEAAPTRKRQRSSTWDLAGQLNSSPVGSKRRGPHGGALAGSDGRFHAL